MPDSHDRVFERCPACDSAVAASRALFEATLFGQPCTVRKCRACGLVFKSWFRAGDALGGMYAQDYVHFAAGVPEGGAELNSARQKLARCAELMPERGAAGLRLLDIGCGAGGFVGIARRLGYEAHGIDPYLPVNLQSAVLHRGTPAGLGAGSYDIVVMLNVAEHVPEPRPLFASVRRVLKPGGVLLVSCPYGDSFARRFHRARWCHLALDEHVLFWTPESVRRMARSLGFRGRESYRIAGSPFPFGRADPMPVQAPQPPPTAQPRATTQAGVWRIARRLQAHEATANVIRRLVHLTRSGDYLEYAIATGGPA